MFLTTELLESILRHLPMKDLLLAQRVPRKWPAVTSQSPELQQHLFYLPKNDSSRFQYEYNFDQRRYRMTKVDEQKALGHAPGSPGPIDYIFQIGSYNPLMFHREFKEPTATLAVDGKGFICFDGTYLAAHPEGSLRNMLTTQPPSTVVDARYWIRSSKTQKSSALEDGVAYARIPDRPGGVRVKDAMKEAARRTDWYKEEPMEISLGCEFTHFPTDTEIEQMEQYDGQWRDDPY